jgi:hypothetical protein
VRDKDFSFGAFLSTSTLGASLLDVGARLGLFFSTFKNKSTLDDFVFGSYEFIIRCIAGVLVAGGGDGGLGTDSEMMMPLPLPVMAEEFVACCCHYC